MIFTARTRRCRQTEPTVVYYRGPGWLTRNVFNRAVAFLAITE
jgi:hypothetical protein